MKLKIRMAMLMSLAAVAGMAQEAAENPAADLKNWKYSAELDTYRSYNFNRPASGESSLRNFDGKSGAFVFDAGTIDLEYKATHLGFHVSGGYGDMLQTMAASDSLKGANQYLTQAYVTYRPLTGNALQLDFGKFFTSIGGEVPDARANFNYSRSLLFTLGSPYYHFGFRASVPVTKHLTAGVQVVNGWNDVRDNNSGKTMGFTTAYTRDKWAWTQVYMTGPEKTGTNQGYRHLVDQVFTVRPASKVEMYVEGLYGFERRTGGGSDKWYGAAAAARLAFTKKVSISSRMEWFGDPAGFTSGTAQKLWEGTGTLEYKLNSFITTRFEYRRDASNQAFFETGSERLSKNQQTALMALMFSWDGEHAKH